MSEKLTPERLEKIRGNDQHGPKWMGPLAEGIISELLGHIDALEAELAAADDVIAEYEVKIEDLEAALAERRKGGGS